MALISDQNLELRLHIATPNGIVFDDLIATIQIKVHDGYMAVNRNRFPSIHLVQMGLIIIRMLSKNVLKEFLIGSGVMVIDKYLCQVYVDFFIDPKGVNDNEFLKVHNQLKKTLMRENRVGILNVQTELMLRREIAKLKKI